MCMCVCMCIGVCVLIDGFVGSIPKLSGSAMGLECPELVLLVHDG